jgi:DNA-binding NarL/FixJ family response regulator
MSPQISPNGQADINSVKILLADDQPKVRSALRLLLEQETHWQIVAEVEDLDTLLSVTQVTCPDIILLDWELPGINGKESISNLKARCSGVKIVALSSQIHACNKARQAAVDAFVSKSDPPEKVLAKLSSLESDQEEKQNG